MGEKRVVLRPHAPLMWVAVALMAGYALAEWWGKGLLANIGWLGVLAAISFAAAYILRAKARWKFYGALGILACGAIYYGLREARADIPLPQMAAREAEIIVEPRQPFALRADSGREAGLGIIKSGELAGQKINYSVRWKLDTPLEPRSQVLMFGVLAPNKTGGEGFDEYLERSHVAWSLGRGDAKAVVKPANALWHGVAVLHRWAAEVLQRRWSKSESSGLLPAMVMGEKAELTPTQKENFVRSGTMHLVAVSGLNVMAVAFVLWGLVKLTRLPRIYQAVLVVVALSIYALVTGAGPSVLRAWGMVSLGLTAWALRRQMNLWAVVVLAATISLIIEPLSFMHAGWRLSFGVVSGIVLGMGAIERWGILQNLRGVAGWLIQLLTLSLVAGISVAPMTAAYWGIAQPLGFVVNAVAVTLASGVTVLGTFSWLVAWLPGASATVNELAYLLLRLIDAAIEGYLKIPGSTVELPQAKAFGAEIWGTVAVLSIFYILSRWAWRKKFAAA